MEKEKTRDSAFYEILEVLDSKHDVVSNRWADLASHLLHADEIDHLWNRDLRMGLVLIQGIANDLSPKNLEKNSVEVVVGAHLLWDARLGYDDDIKALEAVSGALEEIVKRKQCTDITRRDLEYIRADLRIMISEMRSVLGTGLEKEKLEEKDALAAK